MDRNPVMDFASAKVNPDLAKEREKGSFDVLELTYLLHGGRQKTERKRYLESLLTSDPVFRKEDAYVLDREYGYERNLQRYLQMVKLLEKCNIIDPEDINTLNRLIGGVPPYHLNNLMFIPTIKNQGTEEQRRKWIPLAETYQILGTYAQTELGHGTNVRGLETTATYEKNTQEFVIHSPSLSACKWWPGSLGKTSTHAIVPAQLITNGKDHGIQMFIVQLRNLQTHRPVQGIRIGDIGPKFSMVANAIDNGFLVFDHVRIPRDHMLMGLSKVAPDGTFSKPVNSKAIYSSMSYVRATIVADSFRLLSQAVTIATRYSAVRRQSELKPGEPESQIINYKTQQYKLLPGLATVFAIKFAFDKVWNVFHEMQDRILAGDFSMLPEVHCITSGLKAFTTSVATRHAETCRLACGGHGFLLCSGLPELYALLNASCTYEGDNDVLYLQVARYLVKCISKAKDGGVLPLSLTFLSRTHERCRAKDSQDFLDPQVQLRIYEDRTLSELKRTTDDLQRRILSGMDPADAWNEKSVDLVRGAKGYSNYMVVLYAVEAVDKLSAVSDELRAVLKAVTDLFILWGVVDNSGSFLEAGTLDSCQIQTARNQVYTLMEQLRPDTVSLVDAFDHSDYVLNSALGRYDGNVYEDLFRWAQKSALNKHEVLPAYYKYLRPLMQSYKSKL